MAAPRPGSSQLSLTAPLTRNALNVIRNALEEHYTTQAEPYDPSETHAAVLAPFCNVNGRPGILLEVRGKLRTHSGEVRCAVLLDRTQSSRSSSCMLLASPEAGLTRYGTRSLATCLVHGPQLRRAPCPRRTPRRWLQL